MTPLRRILSSESIEELLPWSDSITSLCHHMWYRCIVMNCFIFSSSFKFATPTTSQCRHRWRHHDQNPIVPLVLLLQVSDDLFLIDELEDVRSVDEDGNRSWYGDDEEDVRVEVDRSPSRCTANPRGPANVISLRNVWRRLVNKTEHILGKIIIERVVIESRTKSIDEFGSTPSVQWCKASVSVTAKLKVHYYYWHRWITFPESSCTVYGLIQTRNPSRKNFCPKQDKYYKV